MYDEHDFRKKIPHQDQTRPITYRIMQTHIRFNFLYFSWQKNHYYPKDIVDFFKICLPWILQGMCAQTNKNVHVWDFVCPFSHIFQGKS